MPPEPTRLYDMAAAALLAVQTYHGGTLPDRQFVSAGPPVWDCVAAGTMVHTANRGPVPIEDVVEGDEVWAWDAGRMVAAPVAAVLDKGVRSTVRIRTNSRSLDVTPDHRMLTLEVSRSGLDRRWNTWRPVWVTAKELRRGSVVVVVDSTPDNGALDYLSDGTALDADVAWLLGVFVADGTLVRGGAHICVFGATADRVVRIVADVWGANSSTDKKHGVVVSGTGLRRAFASLGLDLPSTRRRVPLLVRAGSHKVVRGFLDGYAEGDGHFNEAKGSTNYASANASLMGDVRALHMSLGDAVSNIGVEPRTRPIVIRGRLVKDALPLHRFRAHVGGRQYRRGQELRKRGVHRALPDSSFTVENVLDVTDSGEARVYDLSVPGPVSFLADGMVAHNCPLLAVHVERTEGYEGDVNLVTAQPLSSGAGFAMRAATLGVTLVRCTPAVPDSKGPKVSMPSVADEEAAALTLYSDAQRVLNALVQAHKAGELGGCRSLAFLDWSVLGPEGGMVAGLLRVRAGLVVGA